MNVCFVGKHKYPKDIFSNELDMKTWRSLGAYFDRLFVIAESPDLFFRKAREKNISVYLLPRLGYLGFIKQSVFLGLYLNWHYGVDVFDASEVAGGGATVSVLKFFTGKPTVIEVQGEIFRKVKRENLKSWLLKKIGRYVMRKAARVRVISQAIYNQVLEQGIPESKIRLVSLRVDLNLFNPLSMSDIDSFGDKVGITKIGYLGRLVDGKGLEDLFKVIAILKSQDLKFNCLIFGTGPLEAKLKKMADDLEIADKIEWRGFVPYGKVPEALMQIDIFVYPSWHEGFGRSIMEALAMEKAVVATRVGGIPDLVKDGENGFLVESHNSSALAQKIKELIENKELREKFGKAGREHVSKNYEWNDGIKKFAQLFLELK
ncbi:MAG: glycosyltransferase family 4 protein [Parcubacteria group bacterium]|nr:glycosyltransferase family 4 protein [Parcubacteria group bacterium]